MTNSKNPVQPFSNLIEIMSTLLGPTGCPWDRDQTHESLKRYLLEETYECLEAIDEKNPTHLKEELGDVLLQVVFHAALAQRKNQFCIDDVLTHLNEKLVRRHPHVFADGEAPTAEDVLTNWDRIKKKESGKTERSSLLDGIPKALPALARAKALSKKAAKGAGFDWKTPKDVWNKINEELSELKSEEFNLQTNDTEPVRRALESEIGDVFFALANLARHYDIDPEEALQKTNARFSARFQWMEKNTDIPLISLSNEQKESLWQSAKHALTHV